VKALLTLLRAGDVKPMAQKPMPLTDAQSPAEENLRSMNK